MLQISLKPVPLLLPHRPLCLPQSFRLLSRSFLLFKKELAADLHLSNVDALQLLAQDVKHVLTHRILLLTFTCWKPMHISQLPDDYIWIKEEEIEDYGIPRLIELMLEKISCK